MNLGTAHIIRANSRNLPLADDSVDLVVTSPPYFALRSYQDGGAHYAGQIGDEPTPAEFVDSLLEVTAECVRVLKQSGSLWVNLGDSYAGSAANGSPISDKSSLRGNGHVGGGPKAKAVTRGTRVRRPAPQMTREDAAWLAGVIDSDGSVSIHINKQPEGNAPSFVPWMRVGQMRPEVVAHIAEVTGIGSVVQDGRGVYNWGASAQQARWVLERIHPWLLIKKRQAWAAIEVARHVEARNAKGSWRALTSADVTYRQRLRDAVLTWNRGEPDDLSVPDPGTISLPHDALDARAKSLRGIPWRYALRCIDDLGLILRAEVIWSKPNGLPESVTDRVRRSHETWFHFTLNPRYFSAVDEIREPHAGEFLSSGARNARFKHPGGVLPDERISGDKTPLPGRWAGEEVSDRNPLGKLPGSVWQIATEPLRVPDHLGVDHFAAFPTEWPKRIIQGWSPAGVCVECGEGRRPVRDGAWHFREPGHPVHVRALRQARAAGVTPEIVASRYGLKAKAGGNHSDQGNNVHPNALRLAADYRISRLAAEDAINYTTRSMGGYACDCEPRWVVECGCGSRSHLAEHHRECTPPPDMRQVLPPTTPAVILDPFGGTGTTAMVAKALGRHGISVDMSADYCRLAEWRCNDRDQLAKVLGIDKADPVADDEQSLLDLIEGGAA